MSPAGTPYRLFIWYLNEALQAELTPKQACVFFVSQVHSEVTAKLKEWIRAQDAEFQRKRYEDDGRNATSSVSLRYSPI